MNIQRIKEQRTSRFDALAGISSLARLGSWHSHVPASQLSGPRADRAHERLLAKTSNSKVLGFVCYRRRCQIKWLISDMSGLSFSLLDLELACYLAQLELLATEPCLPWDVDSP